LAEGADVSPDTGGMNALPLPAPPPPQPESKKTVAAPKAASPLLAVVPLIMSFPQKVEIRPRPEVRLLVLGREMVVCINCHKHKECHRYCDC
jgi:hypothetical protein